MIIFSGFILEIFFKKILKKKKFWKKNIEKKFQKKNHNFRNFLKKKNLN